MVKTFVRPNGYICAYPLRIVAARSEQQARWWHWLWGAGLVIVPLKPIALACMYTHAQPVVRLCMW